MQRATTPHHTFKLRNVPANTITKFSVTYLQEAGQNERWEPIQEVKLTKKTSIPSAESWITVTQPTTSSPFYIFEVDLTIVETKLFHKGPVEIQFTVYTTDGQQIKSPSYVSRVDNVLDDSDISTT